MLALDPAGRRLAIGAEDLVVRDLVDGSVRDLARARPSALSWASDGQRLAASFVESGRSRVEVYALGGAASKATFLPGEVVGLAWLGPDELLALGFTIKVYSFAGELRMDLHRWRAGKPVRSERLGEAQLKRGHLRLWGHRLAEFLRLELSPLGDEIAYTSIKDPPAFPPSTVVTVRHLETRAEVVAARVALGAGQVRFSADGERLLVGSGPIGVSWIDPWTQTRSGTLPVPGRTLAVSPTGRLVLADGRLYVEGHEQARFADDARGLFAALGGTLVVVAGERLHVVSGLAGEPGPTFGPAARAKLLLLRRWRGQGLITPLDYREARRRLELP
ncbi:MAG: hypothetical protein IT371_16910 [Deltaproteobacteria bacterium]|nr:hypothetical protein [Deltaproteobacteria bacterium]